jgi:hypothetical protein
MDDHRSAGSRPRVFISYSRRDVYFAEYIAVQLALAGIDPWLDFYKLRPGTNWPAEITHSIAASDMLILLASPHALQSAYVESEWRTAIRAGKAMCIALISSVALPGKLQNIPVMDLRFDLSVGTKFLVESIEGMASDPGTTQIAAHMTDRRRAFIALIAILIAFTVGVWLLDVTTDVELALQPASDYIPTFSTYGPVIEHIFKILAATLALSMAGTVFFLYSVLIHRFRYWYRSFLTVGIAAGVAQILALVLGHLAVTLPRLQMAAVAGSVLTAAQVTIILFLRIYSNYSNTLLVRSEQGYCVPGVRNRMLQNAGIEVISPGGARSPLPSSANVSPGPGNSGPAKSGNRLFPNDVRGRLHSSYCLDYETADSRLARDIRDILSGSGLREDSTVPGWRFVIITNFSNFERLETAVETQDAQTVSLLCTSIPKSPDWAFFRTRQWIDLREANRAGMADPIKGLVEGKVVSIIPRSPDAFCSPFSVQALYNSNTSLAPLLAVLSGGLILRHEFSPISAIRAATAIVASVLLIRVSRLVAGRRVPATRLRNLVRIGASAAILCGILRIVDHANISSTALVGLPGSGSPTPSLLVAGLRITDFLISAIFVCGGLVLIWAFHLAASWLPGEVATSRSAVYPPWLGQLTVLLLATIYIVTVVIQFPMLS